MTWKLFLALSDAFSKSLWTCCMVHFSNGGLSIYYNSVLSVVQRYEHQSLGLIWPTHPLGHRVGQVNDIFNQKKIKLFLTWEARNDDFLTRDETFEILHVWDSSKMFFSWERGNFNLVGQLRNRLVDGAESNCQMTTLSNDLSHIIYDGYVKSQNLLQNYVCNDKSRQENWSERSSWIWYLRLWVGIWQVVFRLFDAALAGDNIFLFRFSFKTSVEKKILFSCLENISRPKRGLSLEKLKQEFKGVGSLLWNLDSLKEV